MGSAKPDPLPFTRIIGTIQPYALCECEAIFTMLKERHMKAFITVFVLATLFCTGSTVVAQVTNTKINGSTGNFSIAQGDSLRWEYDLPVGGSAKGEFWIDLNANGVIDSSSDKLLFGGFSQTDGDTSGNQGPGDLDGTANGHVIFRLSNNGVPPAKYIIRFANN